MFFWVGLVVILVVFVTGMVWAVRGMSEREHKPGTQRLR
jgi:hypothetical protein